MRLADVSATLDFGQKLKLRKRLDDLKTRIRPASC